MRLRFSALLLAAAVPALGAATGAVRRGDLLIPVKVEGTVVPEDVYRLKSTLEGRVEGVNMSSGAWRGADEPLAMDSPLRKLGDKVLLSPHAASFTVGGGLGPGIEWATRSVMTALDGGVPDNVYNKEAIERWQGRFGGAKVLAA